MQTQKSDFFCWRVQQQMQEGGFILVSGDPGTGKSVLQRLLIKHLSAVPDVTVGTLTRPQSSVSDFYREMGNLFGISLSIANKFGGFKSLRERWQAHIETTTSRPILLFDEAQMAQQAVLSELRLLSSTQFDSASILTVVLIGDERLLQLLQTKELRPLESRIRFKMIMDQASKEQLTNFINHCLDSAGNPKLITQLVIASLAEHAAGNYRTLTNLANELLNAAIRNEVAVVDEKLYFETFTYHADKFKGRGPKAANLK